MSVAVSRREQEGLPEARDARDELLELIVVLTGPISWLEPVGPVTGFDRQAAAPEIVQELIVFEAESILALGGGLVRYEGDTLPRYGQQSTAAPQAMLMHDT